MNTAHRSRQPRQRLKMFLPANAHCPAMRLTEEILNQRGEMSNQGRKKMLKKFYRHESTRNEKACGKAGTVPQNGKGRRKHRMGWTSEDWIILHY
jgi:hypothetical protein